MHNHNNGLQGDTNILTTQKYPNLYGINETIITDHAVRRAQQRGVSKEAIKITAHFGKPHRTTRGLFRRIIGKKELHNLRKLDSLPKAVLEKLDGLSVVTSEETGVCTVVTVIGKIGSTKRLRS